MLTSLIAVSIATQATDAQDPLDQAIPEPIVVTAASLRPVPFNEAPASISLLEQGEIEAIDLPHTSDLLRLLPGVSVSTSGPAGSQTQIRIRGAEANHSLFYVDGIRFNDPASGNEPRFELLTSDLIDRLELVRGPQSALWGPEALGGVIAATTADPLQTRSIRATAEYGSFESVRGSARGSIGNERVGLTVAGSYLSSDGIDSFGAGGERDGFDNTAFSARFVFRPDSRFEFGVVGHHVEGTSDFDGSDPVTFLRANTLDATDNRISAVRAWGSANFGPWSLQVDGSYLDSANENRTGTTPLNSTFGQRSTASIRVGRTFGGHEITVFGEYQDEAFSARDTAFFGGTDQDVSRNVASISGEWRARWTDWLQTDVAVRHDDFSDFDGATSFRAAVDVIPAAGWTIHGAYGQGIAQPSFYDLYGFFPGSFVGNPNLTAEQAEGWEFGVRYGNAVVNAGVTYFSQNLTDEIVSVFNPVTFISSTANATGTSERRGIEADATIALPIGATLRVTYTYLDADEQGSTGATPTREVRRPRHSGSIALFGDVDRFSWSATAAYVGERTDTNFDVFPAATVTLGDYVLASARVSYRLVGGLEVFARAENAFDADYQDAFGYFTQGTSVYAGLRLAFGR